MRGGSATAGNGYGRVNSSLGKGTGQGDNVVAKSRGAAWGVTGKPLGGMPAEGRRPSVELFAVREGRALDDEESSAVWSGGGMG